jgi:HEAT repeat protein
MSNCNGRTWMALAAVMASVALCVTALPAKAAAPDAAPAPVPSPKALEKVLAEGKPQEKLAAVNALKKVEPLPDALIPVLFEFCATMAPMGWAVVGSPAALADMRAANGARSTAELMVRSAGKRALPTLMAAMQADNRHAHEKAIAALHALGADAEPALPQIKLALGSDSKLMRRYAIRCLGNIGEKARGEIPKIRATLQENKNEDMRAYAAEALGKMGATDPKSVSALIAALTDKDWFVGANAADAIELLEFDPRNHIQELIGTLKSPDIDSLFVGATLEHLVRAKADAVAPLIKLFDEPEDSAAAFYASIILRVMAGPAVPALQKAFASPKPMIRARALRGLAGIKDDRVDTDAVITKGLASASEKVRWAAIMDLHHTSMKKPERLAMYSKYLLDPHLDIRLVALLGLGEMQADAEPAFPAIMKAAKTDESPQVRASAWYAAANVRPAVTDEAVALLISQLDDKDALVRKSALAILFEFGARAAEAKGKLTSIKNDPGRPPDEREMATGVLFKIEQESEEGDAPEDKPEKPE